MKRLLTLVVLSTMTLSVYAAKPCEELKSEITAKIEAKGVKGYSLEIVPASEAGDKKVVGSCEAGTKKIVYVRQ